jgi:hypothetical protein
MLGLAVREFAQATPFVPFVIQMTDGRRFRIRHPDYVNVSPHGSRVFVFDDNENQTHLSGLLIASVNPIRKHKPRHSGRK